MKNTDFEIRTSELTASNKKLVGYAVRWNSLSEIIWDEFREQFTPGAFADYLAAGNDVRCLYEHDYTQLLGRTKSGTLVLTEDNTGLRFELTPPDTVAVLNNGGRARKILTSGRSRNDCGGNLLIFPITQNCVGWHSANLHDDLTH